LFDRHYGNQDRDGPVTVAVNALENLDQDSNLLALARAD
jgi:hypothetical protein